MMIESSELNSIYYSKKDDTFYETKKGFKVNRNFDLLSICVRIGDWCNYSCPYCLSSSSNNGTWMTKENLNLLSTFFDKFMIPRIVISGGEPTYFKDLGNCLERLKTGNNNVILATNGSRFVDFSNYVDWVDISLHGYDDHSHINNTNSHDQIKKNYKFRKIC
jgi:organic radical activating enzyme